MKKLLSQILSNTTLLVLWLALTVVSAFMLVAVSFGEPLYVIIFFAEVGFLLSSLVFIIHLRW